MPRCDICFRHAVDGGGSAWRAHRFVPWGAAALGAVMALAAWIVYRKLGLALLRTAWFNLDWLWAAALVVAGFVVLLV